LTPTGRSAAQRNREPGRTPSPVVGEDRSRVIVGLLRSG
jgi:hypothetical protein